MSEQSNDRSYRTLAVEFAREYYSVCRTVVLVVLVASVAVSGSILVTLWPTFVGGYLEAGMLPWEIVYGTLKEPKFESELGISDIWGHLTLLWFVFGFIGFIAAAEVRRKNE